MVKEIKTEMRLVGFNLTKIHAEKNPNFQGKLEINTNVTVPSIEKHKLDISKEEAVKVDFNFDVSYKELGKVELSGQIFMILDSKSLKEILAHWKDKDAESVEKMRVTIFNIIIQKCSLKALSLEEEMGLPPHVQMPSVSLGQNS
jgi:hypothetical protein